LRVVELWRYSVKSLQGERVAEGELGPQGLAGDRRYAIFDGSTGFGLTARRHPELLFARARVVPGGVEITLPDGSVAADDAALSAWLGRPVRLRSTAEVGRRVYENPADTETEAADSWHPFEGSGAAFHDSAAVTLLSTDSVAGVDPRRFRPNVLLAGEGEDALVGTRIRLGDAVLDVVKQVSRCVMVTRPQPGGIELDRDVLRRIHRERGGCLAVGGFVRRPGRVRVGDEITETVGALT
jgi:uncharacterized protein YcbX